MPKIVTANLLATGVVVFLDARGEWVADVAEARLYADEAEATQGLEIGERDAARSLIVDPFVTDRDPQATTRAGMTLRDSIRANGPTIEYLPAQARVAEAPVARAKVA